MTLNEKLSKFKNRKREVGVGDAGEMEWVREQRKRELEKLLPVVKELKPVLDDVNKGWLGGKGKIEGPYIRKDDENYNFSFAGIDLKNKPEIDAGASVVDGNGYFALRLRVDRYRMVRVIGADEKFVWGSVAADDEDLREKVERIVFEVVTETNACH